MVVSNKRKSMKKINKHKLSKKTKKTKKTKKNQNGGVIGDKYKYNNCEYKGKYEENYNIQQCCIECNLNDMVDFYKTKNRNILKEFSLLQKYSSSNIKTMEQEDKVKLFYIGYYYEKTYTLCLFVKGENLDKLCQTDFRTKDSDIIILNPKLVVDLITNKFVPPDYYPLDYSPPIEDLKEEPIAEPVLESIEEPIIITNTNTIPVTNNSSKKKTKTKSKSWQFWRK